MLKKNIKINSGFLYNSFFYLYIFFLFINNYYLFSEINNPIILNIPIPCSNWDYSGYSIDLEILNNPLLFFSNSRAHNIALSVLSWFINNRFLIFNLTPTLLLIVCLFLVYQIGSTYIDKPYGLLASFIFSSLPITIIYSKFNIFHLEETLYLLLCIFFYLKSKQLKNRIHTILYILTLVSIIFFLGQPSAILYAAIIFSLTLYFLFKKNKKMLVFYFLLISILSFLFLILHYPSFKSYLISKLPYNFPNSIVITYQLKSIFFYTLFKLPYKFEKHLYSFYFYGLIIILLPYLIERKKQTHTDNEEFPIILNFLILIPLAIHILTSQKTRLEDIFPIFAFLSLKISDILYFLNKKSKIVPKIKSLFSNINQTISKKYLKNILLFFLFFYGISLTVPYREKTLLAQMHNLLPLKKVIYISNENKLSDIKLTHIKSELLTYLSKIEPKTLYIICFPNTYHWFVGRSIHSYLSQRKNIHCITSEDLYGLTSSIFFANQFLPSQISSFKENDCFVFITFYEKFNLLTNRIPSLRNSKLHLEKNFNFKLNKKEKLYIYLAKVNKSQSQNTIK